MFSFSKKGWAFLCIQHLAVFFDCSHFRTVFIVVRMPSKIDILKYVSKIALPSTNE